ncbi:hypothetical protein PR002_g24889 [Phytophthora rubi]|uniref:Reverse transcriptase Ty1/copia-type domain-containing protein n=1 Tax=Phytophthora rubi TaxID=129364 RepID=A0A6A3I6J2_9STRA|nr:hypothetical protein PR002_g24889 [Phytophthora rubi]
MRQGKGFEKAGHERKVWRLRKALYGLKQAGRAWHMEFDSFLKSLGLNTAPGDACLYYARDQGGLFLVHSWPIPVTPSMLIQRVWDDPDATELDRWVLNEYSRVSLIHGDFNKDEAEVVGKTEGGKYDGLPCFVWR